MVALDNGFWEGEMIFAMDIDMLETQWSEAFHILWSNLLSSILWSCIPPPSKNMLRDSIPFPLEVGNERPSQFSRDYRWFFCLPPLQDIKVV